MFSHTVTSQGITLNIAAARERRVAIGAWDLGHTQGNTFLSEHAAHCNNAARFLPGSTCCTDITGAWELLAQPGLGENPEEVVLVHVEGRKIGHVNRRAAAMLWPLLADDIIWVEVKHTAARGEPRVSIYIFASLGQGPLAQVVKEPKTTAQQRAYLGLLTCTKDALKNLHAIQLGSREDTENGKAPLVAGKHMFPGAIDWDYASGSIGNTVSTDLVNLLGSRMLAVLRDSGAPLVTSGGYDAAGS